MGPTTHHAITTRLGAPPPALWRPLRKASGLTLADVAGRVGVALQTVHRWEIGASHPTGPAGTTYAGFMRELADLADQEGVTVTTHGTHPDGTCTWCGREAS